MNESTQNAAPWKCDPVRDSRNRENAALLPSLDEREHPKCGPLEMRRGAGRTIFHPTLRHCIRVYPEVARIHVKRFIIKQESKSPWLEHGGTSPLTIRLREHRGVMIPSQDVVNLRERESSCSKEKAYTVGETQVFNDEF